MRILPASLAIILLVSLIPALGAGAPPERATSCVACHSELSGPLSDPVIRWQTGVHRKAGISCQHCHGGDATIMDGAMDPDRGFRGVSQNQRTVDLCVHCHSDADRMKPYGLRIDQEDLFRSSAHGPSGRRPAGLPTCTTCHNAHGILSSDDPLSPAFILNIPSLCARCHGSAGWKPPTGEESAPPQVYTDYRSGVPGRALLDALNFMAPNCASCHGAHSTMVASPRTTPTICGRCHVEEVRHFNASPHRSALDVIGQPGCTSCHEAHLMEPPPATTASRDVLITCPQCHPSESEALALGQAIVGGMENAILSIDTLKRLREDISLRGLNTLQVEFLLQDAENWLSQTIPAFHALDEERSEELTGMALDRVHSAEGLLRTLSAELYFRRLWLLAISLACLVTIALFAAKLRLLGRVERDRKLNDLKESNSGRRGQTP